MKKKSPAKTAKKPAAAKTKSTRKGAKPRPGKPAPATSRKTEDEKERRPSPYTPPPVEGIGWAPFRYPPQ